MPRIIRQEIVLRHDPQAQHHLGTVIAEPNCAVWIPIPAARLPVNHINGWYRVVQQGIIDFSGSRPINLDGTNGCRKRRADQTTALDHHGTSPGLSNLPMAEPRRFAAGAPADAIIHSVAALIPQLLGIGNDVHQQPADPAQTPLR